MLSREGQLPSPLIPFRSYPMFRIVKFAMSFVFVAFWVFTAVVAFQAGGTEGNENLFWFEPGITFLLILGFFVMTTLFYINENRKMKLAE
jgi:hypothetical protein